jgi:hypothetical protein
VLSVDLSSLVIRPPTMTMKLNQKPATVVTSFSQTKFSTRDALSRDRLEFRAAVAAFEDLQAARLSL